MIRKWLVKHETNDMHPLIFPFEMEGLVRDPRMVVMAETAPIISRLREIESAKSEMIILNMIANLIKELESEE